LQQASVPHVQPSVKVAPIEQPRVTPQPLTLYSAFTKALAEECASNSRILGAILLEKSGPPWLRPVALAETREASADVIRQALRVLCFHEMDRSSRAAIFEWVCRVRFTGSIGS
jgi:hypothetical protein